MLLGAFKSFKVPLYMKVASQKSQILVTPTLYPPATMAYDYDTYDMSTKVENLA